MLDLGYVLGVDITPILIIHQNKKKMITKIIKYEADWCHLCKMMDKNLMKFSNVQIEHVNVDELDEQELEKLQIRNLPVCLLFDETGKQVNRLNGPKSYQELQAAINQ